MKHLLLLITLITQSVVAQDFLISTFPSSGSTWLFNAIKSTCGNSDACAYEFFNGLCRGPSDNRTTIFAPIDFESYQNNYLKRWQEKGLHFSKENHIYTKIPFFLDQGYQITILYRHRKHTFPCGAHEWVRLTYQGFANSTTLIDPLLQALQQYCLEHVVTDIEQQVAIHVIATYLNLRAAQDYHLPIIEYQNIMELPENVLFSYLQERMPEPYFSSECVDEIITSRRGAAKKDTNNSYLKAREQNYARLNVESLCQELFSIKRIVKFN